MRRRRKNRSDLEAALAALIKTNDPNATVRVHGFGRFTRDELEDKLAGRKWITSPITLTPTKPQKKGFSYRHVIRVKREARA